MDALEVAEALSKAVTSLDADAVAGLYTQETVVWHSYDRAEQNKAETIEFLRTFFERARELKYSDVRRQRTENGYVQQHVLHTTLNSGEIIEPRPVCMVVEVIDGKVRRLDEYIEVRRVQS